jgi:hypothetical protein
MDEIREAVLTGLQQATLKIEEQAKHLAEVDQVRRALETKHDTAHITAVLSNKQTLCFQALTARIEGQNKQLVELNQVAEH